MSNLLEKYELLVHDHIVLAVDLIQRLHLSADTNRPVDKEHAEELASDLSRLADRWHELMQDPLGLTKTEVP